MDKEQTNASKFLALILRHKPEAAGIQLDEHGWADVGDLLAGMQKAGYPVDLTGLEKIVREDGKQRYTFQDDTHTKIRANQGHSIPVDVELQETAPPDVLYHGTGEKYLDSILEQGLLPQSRLYVHLSPDAETASKVGQRHGKPVILLVDAKAMREDGIPFWLSKNGVWLTKQVATKYLKQMDRGSD